MSTPSQETPSPAPLAEFVSTLPSPLTAALVGLSPSISRLRRLVEILSWRSSWEQSCLALALCWAVCLLADVALRYVFPLAFLLVLLVARYTSSPDVPSPPTTEHTLHRTISDLLTIHALLPSFPSISSSLPLPALLRASLLLYPPYILLTYLVPLRVLLALSGSLLLIHRAPFALLLRRALLRSAYLRWAAYRTSSFLTGIPLPPPTLSPQTLKSQSQYSQSVQGHETQGESIRFLFTVYENQRWWMGLDWTSALIPSERPAWSSASHQPVAPPSAFALPAPTTVFMHLRDGAEGSERRVRRTARWRWEEEEWTVVVHREGAALARVERPLPREKEKEEVATTSKVLKAAHPEKEKEKQTDEGESDDRPSAGPTDDTTETDGEQEPYTDVDGWVYGDNKWESQSSKGGMGKYTRYRRWTRVAVLTETVEEVGPGEVGICQHANPQTLSTPLHESQEKKVEHVRENRENGQADVSLQADAEDGDRSQLRRRLQAAIKRTSLTLA